MQELSFPVKFSLLHSELCVSNRIILTSSWGICWWSFASWWTGQSVGSGRQTVLPQSHWRCCGHTIKHTKMLNTIVQHLYQRLRQMQSSLICNVDPARMLSNAARCKHLTGIRGEKQTNTTVTVEVWESRRSVLCKCWANSSEADREGRKKEWRRIGSDSYADKIIPMNLSCCIINSIKYH